MKNRQHLHNFISIFTGVMCIALFTAARLIDPTEVLIVIIVQILGIALGIAICVLSISLQTILKKYDHLIPTVANVSLSILFSLSLLLFLEYLTPPLYKQGMLFPASEVQKLESGEFTYTARINSLGFRGEETSVLPSESQCRIIVIGDSFTYGFGVNVEDTWPYLMEEMLHNSGYENIEILNLGKPGWGPSEYVWTAQSAAALKPDIVIVALLQYDDLHQAVHPYSDQPIWESSIALSRQASPIFLFNDLRFLIFSAAENLDPASNKWLEQDLTQMSEQELSHINQLDPEARELFLEGNLNPSLIALSYNEPDYYVQVLNHSEMLDEKKSLSRSLDLISDAFGDTPIYVVSIPNRTYSEYDLQNLQKIGFTVDEALIHSTAADDVFETIAAEVNLPFINVTESFREYSGDPPLFFEFDGHFTVYGNRLFAQELESKIENEIIMSGCSN